MERNTQTGISNIMLRSLISIRGGIKMDTRADDYYDFVNGIIYLNPDYIIINNKKYYW